jgi:hypothetical protein
VLAAGAQRVKRVKREGAVLSAAPAQGNGSSAHEETVAAGTTTS